MCRRPRRLYYPLSRFTTSLNFLYREETFAILALNAWELVLKAKLLHEHGNDPRALWVYETRQTKKGQPIKKRFRKRNRSGHAQTLSLGQVLVQLEKRGVSIPAGIRRNLDALIEIRDNAAHYILAGPLLGKQVLEIGTASVANFLNLARDWFGRDLSRHHLYLMPLGFAAPPKKAGIVVTKDEQKLVEYLMSLMKASDVGPNDPYQIALALNIRLKRSSADTAIKVAVTDDPEATKVILTEEDFKATYPWDYGDLMRELRIRYQDFKVTDKVHQIRRPLTKNATYCMARFLDPGNPKSSRKDFYSPNILNEFDKHFAKK